MNPLLTIVVPVYNRQTLITRTLDSIAAARQMLPLTLLIVDNNSADDSRAVCTAWAEQHRSVDFCIQVLEEERPGAPAARNLGLSKTQTPYVYFFDSDDLFSPDFLIDIQDTLISAHETASPAQQTDLFFVPVNMRKGNTLLTRAFRQSDSPTMQIATSMLSTLSMIFRTAWLREIGGWDERLAVWQDWELGVRALLHHPRMRWLTQKAYHEIMLHENSITGASPTTRWEAALNTMRIARETIMQTASATSFNPSPCLRALCLRAYIHAGLLSREGSQEGARAFYAFARQVHSTPSFRLRLLGTVLQHYTALGGRGAWRIMCALLS